ncbi:MAG: AAA family ATPase [Lachnospiraceae bacterium]|nr:AAA family ATPase [Lachnospiraceae bacterium]
MRIKKIHITGFGRFRDFTLELSDGINVITGPNEAGKSTIHLFIRSMLYGADKKRRGAQRPVYERMRPWHTPDIYGGSLEISDDGRNYRIDRDFNVSADDIRIYDIDNSCFVAESETEGLMKRLLNDLSETAYVNTVSSGQLHAATGKDMAAEIKRYAANVTGTVNSGLDADAALMFLSDRKKELEAKLDTNAQTEYNRVLVKIKKTEESLRDPKRNNRISEISKLNEAAGRSAGETAISLGDNELRIKELNSILSAKGLNGERDAKELREKADDLYSEYTDVKKAIPVYTMTVFICLLLGVFAAGCRMRDIKGIYTALGEYAYFFFIVAIALLTGAVLTIFKTVQLMRVKKNDTAKLLELFSRHLDPDQETSLSDQGMELLRKKIDEYIANAARLREAESCRDELVQRLQGLNTEQRQHLNELDEQKRIRDAVNDDLLVLSSLRSEAAVLKRKAETNRRVRDEIDSVDLAADTLRELSGSIREAVGTYINKEASRMISGFSGGRYNSVNAGVNLNVELNCRDGMISVNDVSQGTADQVYMALRLAAIRFIAGEADRIPLILDDSFALYDDERLMDSMKFLAHNYKGQVLIFTCQKREEEILKLAEIVHASVSIGGNDNE